MYFADEMVKGDELLIDFTKQQPVIYKNGKKDFSVLNAPKAAFLSSLWEKMKLNTVQKRMLQIWRFILTTIRWYFKEEL